MLFFPDSDEQAKLLMLIHHIHFLRLEACLYCLGTFSYGYTGTGIHLNHCADLKLVPMFKIACL